MVGAFLVVSGRHRNLPRFQLLFQPLPPPHPTPTRVLWVKWNWGRGRKVETDLFSSPPAGGRRAEPASLNGGSSMPQLPGGPPGRRGPVQCAFHHQTRQMLDLLVAWGAKTGRKLQVQTPNTNCFLVQPAGRQTFPSAVSPLLKSSRLSGCDCGGDL